MKTIFAAQSAYHEGQIPATTERLVNMYPEQVTSGRLPVVLRSCPGLVSQGQFAEGRVRAMLSTNTGIYAVANGKLVCWDGSFTVIGNVGSGAATMAWNGATANEIAIVVGGKYWLYKGGVLSQITAGPFTEFGSVAFVDGYFTFTEKNGGLHTVSGLYDGATIDALDFASAEHAPDDLIRVLPNTGLIWYFGEETAEPWQNVGASAYPFAPVQSTVIEKGLRSEDECAPLDNTVYWVSSEPRVYRQVNLSPQRISSHGVEAALEESVGDVSVFTYQWQGHDFFAIRMSDRAAWVFDAATGVWHERSSDMTYGPWDATASVFHEGTWYLGTADGHLCTLGGFQERGNEMRREAQSRNVSDGGNRFKVHKVDVRCSAGTGGTIMSQYSKDGGNTWGRESQRELGAVGNYGTRQRWHGLGEAREFAFRLACTDNVDFAIYEASVNGRS